jgi:hypothetical protein
MARAKGCGSIVKTTRLEERNVMARSSLDPTLKGYPVTKLY